MATVNTNKHKNLSNRKRTSYFDALKILAIVLVVFNHLPGYTLYQVSSGLITWPYMIVTMITRINVPLFLMVSGALLLNKDESLGKVFKHRVVRIVGVILLFGALIYCLRGRVSFRELVVGLLGGGIEGSYWFLYAYLGMLLLLPFLRSIACRIGRVEFRYLLVLHALLAAVIPMVRYIVKIQFGFDLSVNLDLPLASTKQFFYPLSGYYLARVLDIDDLTPRRIVAVLGAALAGILISCAFTYYQGLTEGYTQDFVQLFDWVSAMAVFLSVRWLFEGSPRWQELRPRLCGILGLVAPLTFAVYLLDPVWKMYFYVPLTTVLEPILPTLLVSLVWCAISLLLGSLAGALMKRVPGLRAIV
jgi:surface polysaccharide O-acyltransferase-like enzyme